MSSLELAPGRGGPARRTPQAAESLAVALVLALAIRSFFLQPCWVPTGSMVPTLVPGDHCLVDRFTYNFRRPERGEILVFRTRGLATSDPRLPEVPQNRIYLKRLVGLPGETVGLGADGHAVIDGVPLDARSPHFADVYRFDPGRVAQAGAYSGHLNAARAAAALKPDQPNPAPLFPNANAVLRLGRSELFVLGDNSVESLDGRAWGGLPRENVLGKVAVVYWPLGWRALRQIR